MFFSPRLGYWIVSRYDDVKAVFRDALNFSPSIALEKVTPSSPEANAILAQHGYAMNRTLVNEDEPAHLERRRALMHSFLPEELEHHEPMVRRLTAEYVDRLIDKGEADLVDDLLWEVPLTVALHFLGVPEEDMETLRRYSIAHTVNTWGRPTAQEQLTVADAVGKFWTYSGGVLDKMRINPSGNGWMEYALRRQKEVPEIVTDSYLHSMMMAGIVAAHETTAHAAANAIRLLLENRQAWEDLCADPSLIPNAVEECLRLAGSIVAWRRLALQDVQVGGVTLPRGSKLLIVMASANHDERHYENPDMLDIYRDNPTDHLSFGYGGHQCLGMNLARMEIRIFLEELTRRIPHLSLAQSQAFTYLPNIAFRGPDHLRVRWDPTLNPERSQIEARRPRASFAIGAPRRNAVYRTLRVAEVERESADVISLTLEDSKGRELPRWSAGAHLDVVSGPHLRKYSLCGDPGDCAYYKIAVRHNRAGRGGSAHIHNNSRPGELLRVRGPKNTFHLKEDAAHSVLIAGGIGITPILAMADRLKSLCRNYSLHYAGRSFENMAFARRIMRDHKEHVQFYRSDCGARLDLAQLTAEMPSASEIYACGPDRLLTELKVLVSDRGRLHVEHFGASAAQRSQRGDQAFVTLLSNSGRAVQVEADQTLLEALRSAGVDVPSDCEEGLCGSCELEVISGDIEHRDFVLSSAERNNNKRIVSCCSRARGELVIAL